MVKFLAFTGVQLQKNVVVDVPTGFGKSLILAVLSKYLIDNDPECIVVVVTLNEYLLLTALHEYSWAKHACRWPSADKGKRIYYAQFADLQKIKFNTKNKIYLLLDEIDQIVTKNIFDLHRTTEKGRRFLAMYRLMFLAEVHRVIAVSGTLTENSLKQLSQD